MSQRMSQRTVGAADVTDLSIASPQSKPSATQTTAICLEHDPLTAGEDEPGGDLSQSLDPVIQGDSSVESAPAVAATMASTSTLPPLHLYRHLLRELSYLPPAFSSQISAEVRASFRKHTRRSPHTERRLQRARGLLRRITQANDGSSHCMASLISLAFGREGRRRAQMADEFFLAPPPSQPDIPKDSAALEKMLQAEDETAPSKKLNHAWIDKLDKPKLLAYLKSQVQEQKATNGRLAWKVKDLKMGSRQDRSLIPDKTVWGKPPSETLSRAKMAKWWKRQAHKMMPPLPRSEWELLGRLSDGAQSQPGTGLAIPRQRTPAVALIQTDEKPDSQWQRLKAYATQSAAHVEPNGVAHQRRRTGESAANGPFAGRPFRQTLSERWFRRAYREIWCQTSYVERDPATGTYSITWGKGPPSSVPRATSVQAAIFDGVDATGNVPGTRKRRP